MPQILIRQLDESIVRKLRAKAAAEGVSAEEEARRILRRSLIGEVPEVPLLEFLKTMPEIGDETILARPKRRQRTVRLGMCLLDRNVVSELRKRERRKANVAYH